MYYSSSQDKPLKYRDAEAFCWDWGGQILPFENGTNFEEIIDRFGKETEAFWYEDDEDFLLPIAGNTTNSTSNVTVNVPVTPEGPKICKEFVPKLQITRNAASCDTKQAFICKANYNLRVMTWEKSITVQGTNTNVQEQRKSFLPWVAVGLAAIAICIAIPCVCCCNSKKKNKMILATSISPSKSQTSVVNLYETQEKEISAIDIDLEHI